MNAQKTAQMQCFIDKFKVELYEKFGMTAHVMIANHKKMPLSSLAKVINTCLFKVVDEKRFPKGIFTRTRKAEVVLHRQCYMTIAYEWGYTTEDIGSSVKMDHATVVHSKKTIKAYLEVGDPAAVKTFNCILNAIKTEIKLRADGDVQPDPKTGTDSGSILPIVLLEREYSPAAYQSTFRDSRSYNKGVDPEK